MRKYLRAGKSLFICSYATSTGLFTVFYGYSCYNMSHVSIRAVAYGLQIWGKRERCYGGIMITFLSKSTLWACKFQINLKHITSQRFEIVAITTESTSCCVDHPPDLNGSWDTFFQSMHFPILLISPLLVLHTIWKNRNLFREHFNLEHWRHSLSVFQHIHISCLHFDDVVDLKKKWY